MTRRKGHHERLVSPETFGRVQERLAEKEKLPRRKDVNADFPLRGFVLCGECRKPYTASWSQGKSKAFAYYRCNSHSCPLYNKSARADRMHGELEDLLAKLRPREAILAGVKAEFLAEWGRRMLDVDAVRKERERKLAAIQKDIDGYLEAIHRCHSPTVLEKIEEEVEALEAKRLRLGGRIEKAKAYDFETSLNLVFDFIKDPLRMWKTGDLGQRRMVLRLVFADPLAYGRGTGFETPIFSPPVAISCVLELDKLELVDMVRRSWNTLAAAIREGSETLRGLP